MIIATLAVRRMTAKGTVADFCVLEEMVGSGISSSIIDFRLRGVGRFGCPDEEDEALGSGWAYDTVGD